MLDKVVLISIHPMYVEKIIAGTKKYEFRRIWASQPVNSLLIYSTSPVQKIIAIIELGKTIRGTKTKLWELAKNGPGGVSRRKLFSYMQGKREGIALELLRKVHFPEGIDPKVIFGKDFIAPQSFRYLKQNELTQLEKIMKGAAWE